MILEVKNLNLFFKEKNKDVQILKDISFNIRKNQCLGILGESGSGKSMLWKSIMGLLDDNFKIEGEVNFQGINLLNMNKEEKRLIRGDKITVIVQNPMTAFDPLFTIENQMIETFQTHTNKNKNEIKKLAINILEKMNISNPLEVLEKYPHELSGGMLQRIMIGLSMALNPSLIIADEPTTAIDSLNQIEIIKELKELHEKLKLTMVFITHDLHILSQVADKIIVMKDGMIVEEGLKEEILNNPQNKQSKFLVETRMKLFKKFEECTKEVL
ncbi:nickel import ATP-binding protein NikD [Malaciobacter mytili LMG 24559]|uniref:Nickel import ATP-binding protein NikD n=1 Tax=Malaciobacter mytili LMG 24559 TaxID=1032238 RepID=A0AAX2AIF0_9BACT|nr:ABC transporter ATP-binding protein [Malaciobacter mytili]AXH14822.1 nickel ABC transporter, ATP-binding protein [Malaciobacter mytili LMG 24559]RXK16807.1 nickel import ATP-binding protein NikD [Malaciobacter mytili LMG 24559]